jgi:23S rRNA pseudoU1915 N3-methylase RlmH
MNCLVIQKRATATRCGKHFIKRWNVNNTRKWAIVVGGADGHRPGG